MTALNGAAANGAINGAATIQAIERVLVHGDLRLLNEEQRITYYRTLCDHVGISPLSKPFDYLVLNGKTVLYANRNATDQLRQAHRISLAIVRRETIDGVHIVTAKATMPDGREDESTGAVSIKGLAGEGLANAYMKAETKAKRRATLSITGLSMLDETEVETVPGAQRETPRATAPVRPAQPPPQPLAPVVEIAPESRAVDAEVVAEPNAAAAKFAERITTAMTEADLASVAPAINAAKRENRISKDEFDRLKQLVIDKRTALAQAGA